jgi:hypothetical protein
MVDDIYEEKIYFEYILKKYPDTIISDPNAYDENILIILF